MELSYVGVSEKKEKQFWSKGIKSLDDLLGFLPRRYDDFSQETGIVLDDISRITVTCNYVKYCNGRVPYISASCYTQDGDQIMVSWFNQSYMYQSLKACTGRQVYMCGKITYSSQYGNYSCSNPKVFSLNTTSSKKIYPVYSKIRGMSEDYLADKIDQTLRFYKMEDTVPVDIRKEYGVCELNAAYKKLHEPENKEDIATGQLRLSFDKILYFALRMEEDGTMLSKGSQYNIKKLVTFNSALKNLPYELTRDQKDVVNDMVKKARDGRRISALVQGDVGCGKSIVAFLMAIAFVDSGYQAAIMAPTQVLANQHYAELSGLLSNTGIKCALYEGQKMKAKDRKKMLSEIKDGSISIIVGTHALIGKDVEYNNLALTIVDEEHKFGVIQKEALIEKASAGVHSITMSATPIPRSLAQVIYGDTTDIYTIKTMPPGRLRTKSCVSSNRKAVFSFLKKELAQGHQAYVVCPSIDKNESMEGVRSVTEVLEEYKRELPGYRIRALTGKTKAADLVEILDDFSNNRAQVLIATTVIEVGVNVPNATSIVIENAERFGLAALHQLRGRVGRGKSQGYCVLVSEDEENERLKTLVSTTDGFVIAESDMKMRGSGEFIGTRQSGEDEYISVILSSEQTRQLHLKLKQDARELLDSGKLEKFLEVNAPEHQSA